MRALSLLIAATFLTVLSACPSGSGSGPCANGVQDADETGVDCGGTCGACAGEVCGQPGECASDVCAAGVCAAPTCTDGVRNGTERGVDCGGTCPTACFAPATCTNGVQDGGETGVDCGGACPACGAGACANGELDPGETDVDCGGPLCAACGEGDDCLGGSDCATGVCAGGVCAVPGATCGNGVKDPGESDVDCGDTCPPCATTRFCNDHPDCLSETCVFGVCKDPTCDDGIPNQGETDVDCGGARCGGCDDGEVCAGGGDCASEACQAGVCVSCGDSQKNQDETGVDCGGATCDPCEIGGGCAAPADCVTSTCIGGTCREEGASAGPCEVEADCDDGFYCSLDWNGEDGSSAALDGACLGETSGGAVGASCGADEECAGVGCTNQFCTAHCEADGECGQGQTCASDELLLDTNDDNLADVLLPYGYCLGFTSPGASCWSQADCAGNQRCTIYLDENPGPGAAPHPDGPYRAIGRCEAQIAAGANDGQICDTDDQCKSAYCSNQGICSRICDGAADCSPITAGGTTYQAACNGTARWGGGQLSDPTTFVRVSRCVAFNAPAPRTPCGPGAPSPKCASGLTCVSFLVDFGPDYADAKAEHFCVTNNIGNPMGQACSTGADCHSGACVPNPAGGRVCSEPCDPQADHCGESGLTCKPFALTQRKGAFANNAVSTTLCQP